MPYRNRKEYKVYRRHTDRVRRSGVCEFCKIDKGSNQFVEGTKSFKVIKNIFPYSFWDERQVVDHLMVVPRKHIDTLDDISPTEASEYLKLIGSYESRGYDVFARAPTSVTKSVPHQHTHLIKPDKKRMKMLFFIKKPFFRVRV
jgi:ATP adenylyltransferase